MLELLIRPDETDCTYLPSHLASLSCSRQVSIYFLVGSVNTFSTCIFACYSKHSPICFNLPSQDLIYLFSVFWCTDVATGLQFCRLQCESCRALVNTSPAGHRLWPGNSTRRRKKPRFYPQGVIPRQGIKSAEGTCVFWYPLCCWTGNRSELSRESSIGILDL